jgi:hypothetical protein
MAFDDHMKNLTNYHLEECTSGWRLPQVLYQEDFTEIQIAPPDDIQKCAFFEAIDLFGDGSVPVACF